MTFEQRSLYSGADEMSGSISGHIPNNLKPQSIKEIFEFGSVEQVWVQKYLDTTSVYAIGSSGNHSDVRGLHFTRYIILQAMNSDLFAASYDRFLQFSVRAQLSSYW
jgi:hypothetical protein